MQAHSPRPLPTHVHRIMWPKSCCLSHWSPMRYMTPSLVVQISSWAVWKRIKKYLLNDHVIEMGRRKKLLVLFDEAKTSRLGRRHVCTPLGGGGVLDPPGKSYSRGDWRETPGVLENQTREISYILSVDSHYLESGWI